MIYLGMAIKYWAKVRGINDRSRGTLSSFSILLMLIHFLQKRKPPIVPSLQDLALELNEPPAFCLGADVRYISDPNLIEKEMQRLRGSTEPNEDTIGQLFHDFFRYYGHEYTQGVIAIRDLRGFHSVDGIDGAGIDKPVYLVVDNPFEVGKDVANVSPNQHVRIRQELRRVVSMIQSGATLHEICSPEPSSRTVQGHGKKMAGSHPLDPSIHSLGLNDTSRISRYSRQR
jgi:DNA polymerase sigma